MVQSVAYELFAKIIVDDKTAAESLEKTEKQSKKTQSRLKTFAQRVGLTMSGLKKTFLGLLSASATAFGKMIEASAPLSVQLELIRFQFSEVWRVLGDAVAPMLEIIVEWVTKLVDWFKGLDPVIQKAIAVMITLGAVLAALIPIVAAITAISSPWLLIILAIIAAIGALYVAWKKNLGGIQDKTKAFIEKIKAWFDTIKPHIQELWKNIQELWIQIKPVVTKIAELFKKYFGAHIKQTFANLKASIEFLINFLKNFVGLISSLLKGDWAKAWEYAKNIFTNFVDFVKNLFNNFKDFFKTVFGKIIDKFKDWGKEMIQKMVEGIVNFLENIGMKKAAEKIREWFGFSLPKKGPLRQVPTWGEHMGQQMFSGLDRSLNKLLPTTAAGALSSLTPSTNAPQMTNNRNINITINMTNNMQTGTSSQMLVSQLSQALEQELTRLGDY